MIKTVHFDDPLIQSNPELVRALKVFGADFPGAVFTLRPRDSADDSATEGSVPLTSVHRREFNVESKVDGKWCSLENWVPPVGEHEPIQDNARQVERFERWPEYRELLYKVLYYDEPIRTRHRAFRDCGRGAWIYRHRESGKCHLHIESCGIRCCPACRNVAQARFLNQCKFAFGNVEPRYLKFATFTIKHSDAPLKEQLKHLRASLRRLRQRAIWKTCVKYGYAVIEIKLSKRDGKWHPHAHCILKSHYIPHAQLKKSWSEVTGDSIVVDIRPVKSGMEASRYLAKYISKPAPIAGMDNKIEVMRDYYFALRGAKLVIPLGRPPQPPDEESAEVFNPMSDDWEMIGTLDAITKLAQSGCVKSRSILMECNLPPPVILSQEECSRPFPKPESVRNLTTQPDLIGYSQGDFE